MFYITFCIEYFRISANIIQNILKDHNHESYVDWQKRGSFDCIILYDWNSSFDHRLPVLNIVYDALTKVSV